MSTSRLILSRQDEGMELTHDEFADADSQEPWRYERVDGRLAVMVPAGHDHQMIGGVIRDYLGAYRLAHPEHVKSVVNDTWIVIDNRTERIADIAVYLSSGEGQIPERIPEIVFEIVSGSSADRRRDYEEKRAEYERVGVREYVIVDRFEHCVTVLRLVDGQYRETMLGDKDEYTTPLLPELRIPLAGLV